MNWVAFLTVFLMVPAAMVFFYGLHRASVRYGETRTAYVACVTVWLGVSLYAGLA